MSIGKNIYLLFYKFSKKFSRAGLYTWLEKECEILKERHRPTPCKILNVGSGGEISEYIKRIAGAEIIQTDIDPERKPDVVADVCSMTMFADGMFDYVFMSEVLEHVKTPQEGINEVYRVLKPGGVLYLSTPFIFPLHDEPYDFYRYTKYGLSHILRNFGKVQITERNDYYGAIYVLFARAIMNDDSKQKFAGLLVFVYMLIQYPFFWLVSKIHTNIKATTGYVVTATK